MSSIDDVAAALINMTGKITTKKFQKLIYYCQAWHLVRSGAALFDDEIQAWKEGPVVRSLYNQHRRDYWVESWRAGNPSSLDEEQLETIRWVVAKYGNFSAESLSKMTHAEAPWRMARGILPVHASSTVEVSRDLMRAFFARQLSDPDVAVALASASSAMEGYPLDDDWQEELRSVADGSRDAEDLIAQEIRRVKLG